MNNDERLDRIERILTLIVRSGRSGRTRVRESIREIDEKITAVINAQMASEDELRKMREDSKAFREESKAMREDLDRRSREVFELFRLTDDRIAQLVDAQLRSEMNIQLLLQRIERH